MPEVGVRQRGIAEVSIGEARVAEVRARQVGPYEVRISKVLLDEVSAGEIVETEANSAQVEGLVAGGGVELRRGDTADILTGVVTVGWQKFRRAASAPVKSCRW